MSANERSDSRPFQRLPLERRSILQLMLRTRPSANAFIEVHNLLADAPDVRSVRPEQVARIADRYRVPLRGEFCSRLERIYRDYLEYCLADHRLTQDEMADLAHLKRILRLNHRSVSEVHEAVARELYSSGVNDLLVDEDVHPDEREFLYALQQCLALPSRAAERTLAARQGQGTR